MRVARAVLRPHCASSAQRQCARSYASDGLITEADQAYLFTRNMLLTIATTGGPTIWYMWKDYPDAPFGTVQQQFHSGQQPPFTPKPAFHALTTLTQQLAGLDFVARVPAYQSGMTTFDDFVSQEVLLTYSATTYVIVHVDLPWLTVHTLYCMQVYLFEAPPPPTVEAAVQSRCDYGDHTTRHSASHCCYRPACASRGTYCHNMQLTRRDGRRCRASAAVPLLLHTQSWLHGRWIRLATSSASQAVRAAGQVRK